MCGSSASKAYGSGGTSKAIFGTPLSEFENVLAETSLRPRRFRTGGAGCLGLDRRGAPLHIRRVAQVPPGCRMEVGIELVNPRHARRDVELHDLLVTQS